MGPCGRGRVLAHAERAGGACGTGRLRVARAAPHRHGRARDDGSDECPGACPCWRPSSRGASSSGPRAAPGRSGFGTFARSSGSATGSPAASIEALPSSSPRARPDPRLRCFHLWPAPSPRACCWLRRPVAGSSRSSAPNAPGVVRPQEQLQEQPIDASLPHDPPMMKIAIARSCSSSPLTIADYSGRSVSAHSRSWRRGGPWPRGRRYVVLTPARLRALGLTASPPR